MHGRLRLEDEERDRLLVLCARVADSWAAYSQDEKREGGGTALGLLTKLRAHLVALSEAKGVSLWGTASVRMVVSWVLAGPVSRWLEGAPDRSILDEMKGREGEADLWLLTDYGRGLLDRADLGRLNVGEEDTRSLILHCGAAAAALCGQERTVADAVWESLVGYWERQQIAPPASSLVELLSWPLRWWVRGGPDSVFLEVAGGGELRASRAALEAAALWMKEGGGWRDG